MITRKAPDEAGDAGDINYRRVASVRRQTGLARVFQDVARLKPHEVTGSANGSVLVRWPPMGGELGVREQRSQPVRDDEFITVVDRRDRDHERVRVNSEPDTWVSCPEQRRDL